jgi:hypothetical protein
MCRLRLGNSNPKLLLPKDLGCRVADRLSSRLNGAASDQRLESLARKRRDCRRQGPVEAPTRMGGVQAHVDRLNSPHLRNRIWEFATCCSMSRSLRGLKLCPINGLHEFD